MLDDAGQRGDAEFQQALHGALNGPQGGGGAASATYAAQPRGQYAPGTTPSGGGFWSRFVTNLQLMTSRT
jgi:hypothetical protein